MATDPNSPIAGWLRRLGTLTASQMSVEDARAKTLAYEDLLRDEFPPACFTRSSLSAVARACKFFPTYGELAAALSAWWRDNRDMPIERSAIEAPPRPPAANTQDRAAEYDPEYLRVQVAKLERDPPDAFRTIAVSLLLTMLERHRPDLLAEVGDQLRALITPARPFRTAYQRHSHAAPAAAPQPPREVPLRPEVMLAQLDREIAAGRATDATRTRAAALRRQLTAAALNPQPRAAAE